MNTQAKNNIHHPLIWVKPELDRTIQSIHDGLKIYTETMHNDIVLENINNELNLLRGSLEILELYAVSLLVESMQDAINKLHQTSDPDNKKIPLSDAKKEEVFESLLQATLSLNAYIDKLHKNQNEIPLSLLPVMNDIRAAIDEPLLSESALFLPNLSIVPKTPGDIPKDYNETCLTDSAKSLRPYYQAALLTWYRDPSDQLSMQQMKLVARNLESSSLTPRNRQIWWILGGLYEALSEKGLKSNITLKLLLAQADRILKTLTQESDDHFEKSPPIDLLKNALYYISQASSNGERVKTLKHVYNLNDVIPSERDITSFKKELSAPNSEALHAIAKELKKSLDQVKATIDNFSRNTPNDTDRLIQTITPLKHIADTMSLLGMGNEKKLLQSLIHKINDISSKGNPPSKEQMLEVASSMLHIESALKGIGAFQRKQENDLDPAQPIDDTNSGDNMISVKTGQLPEAEYRLLIMKIAEEAKANVIEIKNNVLAYLSSDSERNELVEQIPLLLAEIKGGMIVTNNHYLPEILTSLSLYVSENFTHTSSNNKSITEQERNQQHDQFAEVLVSIEYYLEAIIEDRSPLSSILSIAYENLKKLGYPVNMPSQPAKTIPALEAVVTHINEAPARFKSNTIKSTTEHLKEEYEESKESFDTFNAQSSSVDTIDPEVREIFIEEAFEELTKMEGYIKTLKLSPSDFDTLSNIRRIFHTLKGSGKIAGAIDISHVASITDDYLARVLCNSIKINHDGVKVIADSHELLSYLTECYQSKLPIQTEVSDYQNKLESFLSSQLPKNDDTTIIQDNESLENPTTSEQPSENLEINNTPSILDKHISEQEISTPKIIESNANSSSTENLKHLLTIENFIDSKTPDTHMTFVNDDLSNAISQLKIFSLTTDNKEFIQTIDLLSKYIQNTAKKQSPINQETLDILSEFCTTTRELLIELPSLEEETSNIDNTQDTTAQSTNTQTLATAEKTDSDQINLDNIAIENHTPPVNSDDTTHINNSETNKIAVKEPGIQEFSAVEVTTIPTKENIFDTSIIAKESLTEMEKTPDVIETIEDSNITAEDKATSHVAPDATSKSTTPSTIPNNLANTEDEDEDIDLIEIFIEEAFELIQKGHSLLSDYDETDTTFNASFQRLLHTIKGSARMAGATTVGNLAHTLESVFEAVALGVITSPPTLIEMTQESLDAISDMLEDIQSSADIRTHNELLEKLELASKPATDSTIPTIENTNNAIEEDSNIVGTHQSTKPADTEVPEEANIETSTTDEITTLKDLPNAATKEEPSLSPSNTSHNETAEKEVTEVTEEESAKTTTIQPQKSRSTSEPIKVEATVLDKLVDYAIEESAISNRIGDNINASKSSLLELDKAISRTLIQMRDLQFASSHSIENQDISFMGSNPNDNDNLHLSSFSEEQKVAQRLMESIGDIENLSNSLTRLSLETDNLVHQQKKIHNQLHEKLLGTRMVTFSIQTQRMQRILRQTCTQLNKKAHLILEGTDGSIDKSMLDTIMGPLEHIIRNAIAHGIELPNERTQQHKNETGTVKVSFSRDKSDHLIIISDDGAGLNIESIRKKALEKNLIEDNKEYSEEYIANLIFEPGFSTSDNISQISGRGVGMDVVINTIHELGGSVSISTKENEGSVFSIRLPFTLSRSHTLIIRSGKNTYAIPSSSVEHTFPVSLTELKSLYGTTNSTGAITDPVYTFNSQEYPLWYIDTLLNESTTFFPSASSNANIILIKFGQKRLALHVDEIVETRDTVLKPNSPQLSNVSGIAGATVMGDGKIVLIIDVPTLTKLAETSINKPREFSLADEANKNSKTIKTLVVDDSITVRKVTERFLGRNGITTLLAKDGIDALSVLERETPDVILLDIEMPNMDGLELAKEIKTNQKIPNIPIIMITSRSGKQHRHVANDIGVDVFLGKPYQESELLGYIQALTGKRVSPQ